MTHTVMSKTTYATDAAATRAAAKNDRATGELHTLPSGRVCFYIAVQA